MRVAEANHYHQWALLLFGRTDKLPIDSIQHQLGATEHLEVLVPIDVAPREVDEAIASLAMNRRASEVHRRVTSRDDSDFEFPARAHRVAWDKIVWFLPDLDPDADVVERMAVRIAERPSRKIEAVDHNSHTFSLPPPASCDVVRGDLPDTVDAFADWIFERAAHFGLELVAPDVNMILGYLETIAEGRIDEYSQYRDT